MANNHQVYPPSHHRRRCKALYDCEADNEDELSFRQGEIITIVNEQTNDDQWMEGFVDGQPERHGLFPTVFVEFLPPSS